jgi:hypothetical protein
VSSSALARVLLEPHREAHHVLAPEAPEPRVHRPTARAPRRPLHEVGGEHLVDPVEERRLGVGGPPPRLRDRPVDVAPVVGRGAVSVDVAAVHREAGHHLLQRLAQRVECEVARAPVRLGDAVELVREDLELAAEEEVHHVLLAGVDLLVEGRRLRREAPPGAVERVLAGRIHPEPADLVQEVVPGRALHRPRGAQRLVVREDLLDDDVERPLARAPPQALAVVARVEEPVDVVDPEPRELSALHPLEHEPVRAFEDLRALDPQPRELVDVEEASVVDLVRGDAPEGEPVGLRLEQPIERAPARRLAGLAATRVDDGFDPRAHRRLVGREARQIALGRLGALPLLGAAPRGGARHGTALERGEDAVEHRARRSGRRQLLGESAARAGEQARDRARRHGEAVLEVRHGEAAGLGVEAEAELAALEHAAVVVAEEGHEHLAPQLALDRLPVDVEERRPR